MAVLKRIKKKRNFLTIFLICVCLILIISGGRYYIGSLRDDVMNQAISNVLAMTQQQQQAFDTFISGDRERLHSFASYVAQSDSTDSGSILRTLDAFSEIDAYYSVINLETGDYYNNKTDQTFHMNSDRLESYRALSGAGVRDPYESLYSHDISFGYYECFTFADGVNGMFQKGYDRSKVSEEFSLSFYNGQGLGFVVTKQGDILLRSVDRSGQYSFDNIFDMVIDSQNSQEHVATFIQSLDNVHSGTAAFMGKDGSYIFTYVPIHNVNGWYLVSIVPRNAVTREADAIVMNSQSTLIIFSIIIVVAMSFLVLVWRSRKDLEEKNREIEYQERQFDIFSTYLANNTDDIYLMLDCDGWKTEYVSPNVERVLGVPSAEIFQDIRSFKRAKYLSNEFGGTVDFDTLSRLNPGDSMNSMTTERINLKTLERKCFRETVYCVMLQNEKKIVVYISDRTKERQTQEALTQALDMAQDANRAKSSFLGNVSHDIRTPMNAIMGLILLLREEADKPERVLEYTQRIDAASQHLLGLINDVLDINKIEGGNTTLNLAELTLPEIIEELNTIIRPQTRAKNQAFKISASSFSYEHLLGDKLRINQILINILSNAVKYTPEGGTIELSVRELPQAMTGYSHIQFIVRDNGQGMSDEYLKVIFDPFTREQNAKTNLIQGTGLGMAITKSLVDLMGGSISVDSHVGEGSVFTLELELRIAEKEEDPAFWKENNMVRMIVADDDEEVCLNVVKAMSRTGVTVHYATMGQVAIQMMRTARESGNPYDLILLDWKMPDLDGLETARLIRKNYPTKIPILFFTAYDWRDIEEEALDVGVDHFLPKPFFMHSFKEAITRVMSSEKKGPSALKEASIVKGKHILVVDDVEVNRMILVKILHTLGAACDMAENGQVAVDMFTASAPGSYDLILMDVQMPVMDGYTATRSIRASSHPEAQSVAIIAMTANAFVDDVRDALAAGMDAHVSKPIVLDQLKTAIQEVLANKGKR